MSEQRIEITLEVPLDRFDLRVEIATGAPSLGVLGPSGSGKTTLLEAVAGWRRPRSGRVRIGERVLLDTAAGIDLAPERRGVGYLPQDVLLFPHWNVRRNVLAGVRRPAGENGGGAGRERFERAVEVLEIAPLLERSVATLSGGERQRVALARALCSAPSVLLLDEPLGALDLPLRRRILPYLIRVHGEFDVPLVLVSHDATEVQALCDEVCVLERGSVRQSGAPREVFDLGAPGAALGAAENVLAGEVAAVGRDTARVRLAPGVELSTPRSGLEPGDHAVLALRAEDVLVALEPPTGISARNVLAGRVVRAERHPGGVDLAVELAVEPPDDPAGGEREPLGLRVRLTESSVSELGLDPGRSVHLVVKTQSVRVLSSAATDA